MEEARCDVPVRNSTALASALAQPQPSAAMRKACARSVRFEANNFNRPEEPAMMGEWQVADRVQSPAYMQVGILFAGKFLGRKHKRLGLLQ